MYDRVPQSRLYKVWNVPGWGTVDGEQLNLASELLATGKSSRLYKRLVYDEQIATSVEAYADLREIGGLFVIEATAKPGGDLARIERAVDEELARFLAGGPTPAELQRVKTGYRAGFVRGVERIGGFGGKSDVLAQGEVWAGRPDFYKTRLQRVAGATAAQVRTVSARWLSDGDYTLEVLPFGEYQVAAAGADRSKLPAARRGARRQVPGVRAGDAVERPPDRVRPRHGHSADPLQPAAGCRVRGGSVRHARHRQPRYGHARRRDQDPELDRHQ